MNSIYQRSNFILPGTVIPIPYAFISSNDEKRGSKDKKVATTSDLLQKEALRIVFADDDSDDREIFAEAIEKTGINAKVEFAHDGDDLLDLLQPMKLLPHIIFLDLNMPNRNGSECLEILRKKERFKNIPIVIYSTSSSFKDINDTYERGANLYVKKPSSFNDLLKITQRILLLNWESYQPNTSKRNFVFSSKTN